MDEIPTAEEFLFSKVETRSKWITEMMIEFAKMHVKAALEAASKSAQVGEDKFNMRSEVVDKDSILNAYPEENIR